MSKVVAVIPARYASQRLPGKPLISLLGKPMIQWVMEAAGRVPEIDEVLVATDDDRIRQAVEAGGGVAVMTPPECPSGTDRIEYALREREADVVVNVQGDEPGMRTETIQRALKALLDDLGADVGTACIPIRDAADFNAPHVVKVVRGAGDRALYFSRSPIPSQSRVSPEIAGVENRILGYKHMGLYVYRRAALEAYTQLPPSRLEQIECLEQLRFLEADYRIVCPVVEHDSIGVDTEEDVPRAEALLRELLEKRS